MMVGQWNTALKEEIGNGRGGIFFLDYFEGLLEAGEVDEGGDEGGENIMRKDFSCGDGTHMNGGFVDLFVDSILNCGCDLAKI